MHDDSPPMPAAVEAEKAILGSILLDNARLFEAGAWIRPEDFVQESHQRLFARMLELGNAGKPIDPVSLTEELGKHTEIAKVGGVEYISDLMSRAVTGTRLEHYAGIIQEKAQRRRLIHTCKATMLQAADPAESVEACFAQVEESLLGIQAASTNGQAATAKEIVPAVLDEIAAVRGRSDELVGLTTTIGSLDRMTTGIRSDEYWVIGALPSRGKTVLGVQIAAANAKRGIPVLMFSHEMTRRQVIRRILAAESSVPAKQIRDPRNMSNAEFNELLERGAEIAKWPLYVDDPEELSAQELVARARLHIRRFGVKLIVVDYLQLINAPGRKPATKLPQPRTHCARSRRANVFRWWRSRNWPGRATATKTVSPAWWISRNRAPSRRTRMSFCCSIGPKTSKGNGRAKTKSLSPNSARASWGGNPSGWIAAACGSSKGHRTEWQRLAKIRYPESWRSRVSLRPREVPASHRKEILSRWLAGGFRTPRLCVGETGGLS
jgi:replicative DNA helicase